METSLGTRGFLFADLRGYTRYVEGHGDAAGAELLSDWRTLARGLIDRHDGAEIRTEGDGIYVVFTSVTSAVDAGIELVEAAGAATAANPARPIRAAVGIHAGETTATGEGPVGSAVNIAARICAKAEAGEVLVSGTVRDLVRTARPYRATSLGGQHLKGVASPIPVYRMEAAPSGFRTRLVRKARARRRALVLVAAASILTLGLAGATWAVNRPPDCLSLPARTKDVVVRIDPARGCVIATYPVMSRPGAIVAGDGRVWVANRDDWTVSRVDQATGAVRSSGVGGSPTALALTPTGDLLALIFNDRENGYRFAGPVRDKLGFISGESVKLTGLIALSPPEDTPRGYVGVASFTNQPWVSSQRGYLVVGTGLDQVALEADAGSLELQVGVPASTGVGPLAVGAGGLWVGNSREPRLYRIESSGVKPSQLALGGAGGVTALSATDRSIWAGRSDGSVTIVDPFGGSQRSLPSGGRVDAIAASSAVVWVADADGRAVRRIDGADGATTSIPVGGYPRGIAVASDGSVWVTVSGP